VLHGSAKGRTDAAPAEVSNRKPINLKKYLVPALALILAVYILAMIPKTCSRIFNRKPMTAADSLRVAEKQAAKDAKAEAKRLAKEAKKKGKESPAQTQTAQPDPAVDSALAAKLAAKPAGASYQKFLDDLRAANPSLKLPSKVSFITDQADGRSIFVTPGQTIYMAYNYLANDQKVNAEQLTYLITIAAAMGDAGTAKGAPASPEGYYSGSGARLDDATLAAARKLWVAAKPTADYDFTRLSRALNESTQKAGYTLIYRKATP